MTVCQFDCERFNPKDLVTHAEQYDLLFVNCKEYN